MMNEEFLPGLPVDLIKSTYAAAPGHEVERLSSPESSAALAANTFGLFLGDRAASFPPLPGGDDWGWPAIKVALEGTARFPWSGGRHPWLDVLIETPTALIGIESKRYEPFRPKAKEKAELSDAYWRDKWGEEMSGYESIRDGLRDGTSSWTHLDAGQLFKHAFGLRSRVHDKKSPAFEKRPVLFYVYAEPDSWPDRRPVDKKAIALHREEVAKFADIVARDEVAFRSCKYRDLLAAWGASPDKSIRDHAAAVLSFFKSNF